MSRDKNLNIASYDQLNTLYKKWPEIKVFLKSIGCPKEDAEDIFQESLLILHRKMLAPSFELDVDPFHYVKSTCKFLWYNQSRKEKKNQKTELTEQFTEEESNWLAKENKLVQIEEALQRIGEKCQQLLQLFYSGTKSMHEIAKIIGLRNDKVAKAQKYRCINKMKEIVANDYSPLNDAV